MIDALGEQVNTKEEVTSVAVANYSNLFATKLRTWNPTILIWYLRIVDLEMNNWLARQLDKEEIKSIVSTMKKQSVHGPNSFSM